MTRPARLPGATTTRWQPLRLGLVDLFHYDDEQFWFHDGRLLLRGNNGTGKSKVLALALPFLLDGSLAAQRVEPDADPKKRMEWNLLLGGAHPHSERLGYTWVEFGRRDADGVEHYVTLGCGLKAATGRGIVRHWFFVTDQRVGELRLVDSGGVALSRERLREELVGRGRLLDTREEYRRAVDETLFDLGTHRYGALVDLLIQLRQPQLSKRPDERALSGALTEALGPLDQAVIADVAESFRSLEEDRDRLRDVEATHAAAAAFLRLYRDYARVASRREALRLRSVNSEYERLGRDLGDAEQQLAAARSQIDRVDDARERLAIRRADLRGREEALRTSPEMDAARELEHAREVLDTARVAQSRAGRDVEQASTRLAAARAERDRAASDESAARSDVDAASRESARLAEVTGLSASHETALADASAGDAAVARRRQQLHHVARLVADAESAQVDADRRRAALDDAEARAAERQELVEAGERAVEDAAGAYTDAVRGYLHSLSALEVPGGDPGVDDVVESTGAWARDPSAAPSSPAQRAVTEAVAAATGRIEVGRARARGTVAELTAALTDARALVTELEAGHTPQPPTAPTRDPLARAGAPGAPLWRVTDFADGLDAAERAGVEAALEGAGLLDAWLRPDASVIDVATGDIVLGAGAPVVERSLVHALTVAVDPGDASSTVVDPAVVDAVLSRIGWGEESGAAVWVDGRGHFGVGPARGAWSTAQPRYVGAGAREASRRAALQRAREEVDRVQRELADCHALLAALDQRRDQVRAEQERYPSAAERTLVDAHSASAHAARELTAARAAEDEARRVWTGASAAALEARRRAVDEARDLAAPDTAPGLRRAGEELEAYAAALRDARRVRDFAEHATRAHVAAEARARAAHEDHDQLARRAAQAERDLASAEARHATVHGTVGRAVAELEAALAALRVDVAELEARSQVLAEEHDDAVAQVARAETRIQDLTGARAETAVRRDDAVATLRRFTATGLLHLAVPDTEVPTAEAPWTASAAVALARAVEHALDDVAMDQDAWDRAQQRTSSAFTELSAQMSQHGHTALLEQREEGSTVRIRYQAREVGVDALVRELAADVAVREQVLSAREREILENHLVTDVAGHLSDLLSRAQGQVDDLNRELAGRRTSTGMQLRVRWRPRPDGPTGFPTVRDLLLRSDAAWDHGDRAAIGDFLQAQIAAVRLAEPTAGWTDQLGAALDYRTWHDFAVERHQHGQWRPASGPASGGERVLTMAIPLFAAASSHYHSAGNPHAPRLILLDEAFAGVDDDSRAKSLGLLAAFDLDVVMTSEREWGCYPQVPGLAIAQLSRVEGIDAVGVTRWRWDGRVRSLDEVPGLDAAAGVPRLQQDVDATSLFD